MPRTLLPRLLAQGAALLALAPALPAQAPAVTGSVSLTGLGNGNPANPFGLAAAPDGSLWVAVAGVPCFTPPTCNNDVVARIDPAAMAVVATVTVGLFPEEIAFTVDPAQPGVPRHGWVTVNSAGTIVRFGANSSLPDYLAVTDVRPFPSGTFGPFGIAAHPTYPVVYAGDFNCTGTVYALDAVTAQFLPAANLAVPGCHGRLAFAGNLLVVPSTDYSAFPSTCVLVSALDPAYPPGVWTRCIGCSTTGFPSGQDVAAAPSGQAYVLPYDLGSRVHVLDPVSGGHRRTIATGLGFAEQGIGISPNGALLAVTDFVQNAVLFLDAASHQRLATVSLSPFLSPNDVVFLGSDAFVTAQSSEAVVRIGFLPSLVPSPYTLALGASDATPPLGGSTTLTLSGGNPLAILVSGSDAPGPLGGGLALEVGPFFAAAAGAGPALVVPVAVPNDPALDCVPVFVQGIGLAGGAPAASNPISVIPQ